MKGTVKSLIVSSLAIFSASLLITGCHTVQGTVNGAAQDINALSNSLSSPSSHHTYKKGVSEKGVATKSSVKAKTHAKTSPVVKSTSTTKVVPMKPVVNTTTTTDTSTTSVAQPSAPAAQ